MKSCISIKTDYSILTSLIKLADLVNYAVDNKITVLGICDDNLCMTAEFLSLCKNENIKPLVALEVKFNDRLIYLYAKNNKGLKSLFKLNTYLLDNELIIEELKKYIDDLVVVILYEDKDIYESLKNITDNIYIGYANEEEKRNALIMISKLVYFNLALAINSYDTKYINYLQMIKDNVSSSEYTNKDYSKFYLKSTLENDTFIKEIDSLFLTKRDDLIPHYDEKHENSYAFLEALAIKGLSKRLNGNVSGDYKKRLMYELSVIKKMNFVDYFLIVYDYVKYSKKNNIYVGPGRGSAAGSLVTYTLGITNIDPLKYNLLFERFLNPERVTMPDIDIDFDASKRGDVIEYVKKRYGDLNVMPIMTYGTLASKQVLLSVSKILNVDISLISNLIDAKKSLRDNLTNEVVKILNSHKDIKEVYYDALKLEGLKKHISTHAAGIIICRERLDEVIPIIKSGDSYLTGFTMNYLEDLGLLKMDFLAIKNLTTMANILNEIGNVNINEIPLDDEEVLKRFSFGNTTGIFQFEVEGMKNFLRKLKPSSFNDLVVAVALYRPGPMENIDTFIKRKEGKLKVDYIVPSLEPVLKETYGIIVYQEQIMQIFMIIASYTTAEADIIRRAISKKKESVIKEEKEKFIIRAKKNGYEETDATKIYDYIMKFANYGFNKSHSVAYALVAYQMMYLKVRYPLYFYNYLLNINKGSSIKTKEYIDEAKMVNIKIIKPDVNISRNDYYIKEGIVMPLSFIKNVGEAISNEIVLARGSVPFKDFFDFAARIYNKGINEKIIENLIMAGAFDSFGETRATLVDNIKPAILYAELISGLDESLVNKPELIKKEEYPSNVLMQKELDLYGFYISNHPASKFKCPKIKDINNYFDKNVVTVGLLESVRMIKTKKGDSMAFLRISDETGTMDYTIFPNRINYANIIKDGDLLKIAGHVEKRLDKYQIVVLKLEKIKEI